MDASEQILASETARLSIEEEKFLKPTMDKHKTIAHCAGGACCGIVFNSFCNCHQQSWFLQNCCGANLHRCPCASLCNQHYGCCAGRVACAPNPCFTGCQALHVLNRGCCVTNECGCCKEKKCGCCKTGKKYQEEEVDKSKTDVSDDDDAEED